MRRKLKGETNAIKGQRQLNWKSFDMDRRRSGQKVSRSTKRCETMMTEGKSNKRGEIKGTVREKKKR